MSLHKEVKRIRTYSKEPSYEGYFKYIYMDDGTPRRFCRISNTSISYEVSGHTMYESYVESECAIINRPRVDIFVPRRYCANI